MKASKLLELSLYAAFLLGFTLTASHGLQALQEPALRERVGDPPHILSLEFPNVIRPNGSPVQGKVAFFDADRDAATLELDVVRAFDFSPVSFPIETKVQTPGETFFSLSSTLIQPVALEATIVDAQGNRSDPVLFHFAAVTPEREVAPGVYFINAWGEQGRGAGQFNFEGPHGIRVGPDHNVYVVDQGNHRIQVFTPQGEYLTEWGRQGRSGQGRFNFPSDLIFAPNGDIYVSDSLNHRIQVFDSQLNYALQWGGQGFGEGQFVSPRGLALNSKQELFVVDEQNGRIQVFDLAGRFLRQWGRFGKDEGQFNVIVGIDVDSNDEVYVADGFNHRIQVFDSEGNFLRQWGQLGGAEDQFDDPVGVAVSPAGWVAITDTSPIRTVDSGVLHDRVQLWTTQGVFLRSWGVESDAPGTGFKLPLGADADGLGMLYIGDHFNRRAQAFYIAIDSQEIQGAGE